MVGAVAAGILAQFAVAMPGGYFGPSDQITRFGAVYTVGSIVVLLGTVILLARRSPWSSVGTAIIPAVNVGLFIPPLMANPVTAGLVCLWNFFLLSRVLFGDRESVVRHPPEIARIEDGLASWLEVNGPAARHLMSVALVATVAVVGYGIGSKVPAQAVCVALQGFAVVVGLGFLRRYFLHSRWGAVAPMAFLATAVVVASEPGAALAVLASFDLVVLALIAIRSDIFAEVLQHFFGRPALLVLVSFVVMIGLGTVVLTFPAASSGALPLAPIDALFTATSASCVTGLVVLDTPRDFTFFGQFVILILIQAGGLNIMVLSTFAALLLGRGLGLRGERALGEMLDLPSFSAASRLAGFVVVVTLAVEAVGAAILAAADLDRGLPFGLAVWRGTFHSVSAFCNAGFALNSDSLVGFGDQPLVLLVIAFLITVGGLGFAVLAYGWLRLWRSARIGLATQVRIVLIASAALTALGWVGVAAAEWRHSLEGFGVADKLVNALFQSVTCRTAGFNSLSLDGMQPVTILLFMALMFVGASPGGTGGGIKTTTLVVLLSAMPAIAQGRNKVVMLKRTISLDTVYRSTAIAVVAVLVILFGLGALLAIQNQPFESLAFEAVSAFGTVGLSLGVTAELEDLGKLVIVVMMLAGRIGPLSLALLLGRSRPTAVGYPEAKIMVG